MRDFRKFEIWNNSVEIVLSVYKIVKQLPAEEKFGLQSQMSRAAVSIPSNIAEGCSRNSDTEFKRFLEIALGSAFELETQCILSQKLGFIEEEQLNIELNTIHQLQKQINTLIQKIKDDSKKPTAKSQQLMAKS
jgi:four helix bundle protein